MAVAYAREEGIESSMGSLGVNPLPIDDLQKIKPSLFETIRLFSYRVCRNCCHVFLCYPTCLLISRNFHCDAIISVVKLFWWVALEPMTNTKCKPGQSQWVLLKLQPCCDVIKRLFLTAIMQGWKPAVSSAAKRTLSVREVWGSTPGPVKSTQCRQRLATVATFLRSCAA